MPLRPRRRPPDALVHDEPGVDQEGRRDGRPVRVQQPVVDPGQREAHQLLRHDGARPADPRHLDGAAQGVRATRRPRCDAHPLRADLRPRRGRRPTRLPDVHEALRRRRLGGRQPGRRRGRSARRLRGQRHLRDAPAEGRRSARPVRALPGVRAPAAHHPLRPDGAAARPLHGRRWRDQRRRTVAAQRHHAAHQQLLRLGLQLVRGAAPRTPSGTRSTSPTPVPTRR